VTILRHLDEKTKWIGPNGRLISLEISARRDEMPVWLVGLLQALGKRFARPVAKQDFAT
jgi:hypothetical protein